MKEFEIISNGGKTADHIQIPAEYEAAITDLFDATFDMHTAADVIPAIDKAKAKLQADPDKYRGMLTSTSGLRHIRSMLDAMRETLANASDATVSGLWDTDVSPAP